MHLAHWELLCHSPRSPNRYRDTDIDLPLGETCTHAHLHTCTETSRCVPHRVALTGRGRRDIKRNCGDGLRVPTLSHQIILMVFDHALSLLSSLFTPFTPLLPVPNNLLQKPPTTTILFFLCDSGRSLGLNCLLKFRRGGF